MQYYSTGYIKHILTLKGRKLELSRTYLIHLNSLNIRSEIWRRFRNKFGKCYSCDFSVVMPLNALKKVAMRGSTYHIVRRLKSFKTHVFVTTLNCYHFQRDARTTSNSPKI